MDFTAEDYVRGIVPAGAMVRCPFHDDSNASATVMADTGRFWCFGCQTGGDQLDIARRLWFPDDPPAVGYRLARLVIEEGQFPTVKPLPQPKETDPAIWGLMEHWVLACQRELERNPNLAQELGQARGLRDVSGLGLSGVQPFREFLASCPEATEQNLHTLGLTWEDDPERPRSREERYRLGQRIVIPERVDGQVIYYQARSLPGVETKAKYLNPRVPKPLFGVDSLKNRSPLVWIVEGMFDLLPLAEAGQSVLALGGLGHGERLLSVLRQYGNDRPVVIALDADEPGQRMANRRAEQLYEAGFSAYILTPPVHDVGEWVVRDGVRTVIEAGADLTWL